MHYSAMILNYLKMNKKKSVTFLFIFFLFQHYQEITLNLKLKFENYLSLVFKDD